MNDMTRRSEHPTRLEIVHLRPAGSKPPGLMDKIKESLKGSRRRVSVRFYNRGEISTDLAIHIYIETGTSDPGITELGARLASELAAYGMVSHTVWNEIPDMKRGER